MKSNYASQYAKARRTRRDRPPLSDTEAEKRAIKVDRDGLVRCRVCSCSETRPCNPPCAWQPGEADLCTFCHFAAVATMEWLDGAHRPSKAALFREVARQQRKEWGHAV